MRNKFPERLKMVVDKFKKEGGTIKFVSEKTGIHRSTLYKWMNGESDPDMKYVYELARVLDVNIDWLCGSTDHYASYKSDEIIPNARPVGKTLPVPLIGKVPAGISNELLENLEYYIEVPEEQVKHGEYFYLRVTGDSMVGSRIYDGDYVLVRKQKKVESNEIAVVRTNEDEGTLKRVKIEGNICVLYPDNPKYEPQVIDCEEAEILGKVIKVEFDPNKRW